MCVKIVKIVITRLFFKPVTPNLTEIVFKPRSFKFWMVVDIDNTQRLFHIIPCHTKLYHTIPNMYNMCNYSLRLVCGSFHCDFWKLKYYFGTMCYIFIWKREKQIYLAAPCYIVAILVTQIHHALYLCSWKVQHQVWYTVEKLNASATHVWIHLRTKIYT